MRAFLNIKTEAFTATYPERTLLSKSPTHTHTASLLHIIERLLIPTYPTNILYICAYLN